MKTTDQMTKPIVLAAPAAPQVRFLDPSEPLIPMRGKKSLIQWPTERQVREVSTTLARISSMGMRLEAEGDYFKSGDLAYQIQEILRATAELLKRSQRAKR
jgi:hypothetical protein